MVNPKTVPLRLQLRESGGRQAYWLIEESTGREVQIDPDKWLTATVKLAREVMELQDFDKLSAAAGIQA